MKKEILINSTSNEVRVAITEDGKLAELFVESPDQDRNVGDIYLGKVARVKVGIKAVFINLGFAQDAFLHFSDIDNSFDEYAAIIGDDSDVEEEDDDEDEVSSKNDYRDRFDPSKLVPNQDIIVQITKERVGKKGLRVTSKVSIPGRYLVLMPFNKRIGTSKKIYNFKEKRRLKNIVRSVKPKDLGVIVRTVASGVDESLILDDFNNLIMKWNQIQEKMKTLKAPVLLFKDVSTTSSVIRDMFRDDVSKIVVNSKKLYKEIRNYVETTSPDKADKVQLYNQSKPIFDAYDIEKQIDESLEKRVSLKNSGYIIIETTEAMTVIDVNSGKYAKLKDQEMNSLKINFDAAREVVRQLRLRDIGGIIVVDFIDLYDEPNKRKLYDEMRKEFRKDRAKVTVLPMSDFGIIQITRQRIRQSILQRVTDNCPMCNGTGRVQSKASFVKEIERWITRYKSDKNSRFLTLVINPIQKSHLFSGYTNNKIKLFFKYFIFISIETDDTMSLDEFKFLSGKDRTDITQDYNV
ncbi:MAG TPA: Rne/Rng family ribonuclease [Ignavibacteria bacterium]|jgi:ribonuclease G